MHVYMYLQLYIEVNNYVTTLFRLETFYTQNVKQKDDRMPK